MEENMTNYLNSLFFNYLPHLAVVMLVLGMVLRFVFRNDTIHAKSSQLMQDNKLLQYSLLCFHWGILMVMIGHFLGLFTPPWMYEWFMSVPTKRIIAIVAGSFFGLCSLAGIISLFIRRLHHERIRINSSMGDIAIELILTVQILLGLSSTATTMVSPVADYLRLDTWAQAVITFQPDAGKILSSMPWIYKVHIIGGCLIFIIFPYTKLAHFFVAPIQYLWRKSYQLVWHRKEDPSSVTISEQLDNPTKKEY